MEIKIEVAVGIEEVAILLVTNDGVRREFRGGIGEEARAIVEVEHGGAVGPEAAAGTTVAESDVEITVVVDIRKLTAC